MVEKPRFKLPRLKLKFQMLELKIWRFVLKAEGKQLSMVRYAGVLNLF